VLIVLRFKNHKTPPTKRGKEDKLLGRKRKPSTTSVRLTKSLKGKEKDRHSPNRNKRGDERGIALDKEGSRF